MSRKVRRDRHVHECWLYAVSSPKDLAHRLKDLRVTVEELQALAKDANNFKVWPKKSGTKVREIQEPKPRLQRIHARIHELLSRIKVPEYLHSAVRGKSYLSNARAHASDVPIVKLDVKRFFESVRRVYVYGFFLNVLKCRADVAGLLADLLTYEGHLPTGSSASP